MAILITTFITLIACCFLVPFLLGLSKILLDRIDGHFFGDDEDDSVGKRFLQFQERREWIFPPFYKVDEELVAYLVSKDFGEAVVVGFLEHNKLSRDFIAGIKSGSSDKLAEFSEMLNEYVAVRTKIEILGADNLCQLFYRKPE